MGKHFLYQKNSIAAASWRTRQAAIGLARASVQPRWQHYILYWGFNRCPSQLRSYKRHQDKSKNWQKRSSIQQADYQCHRPTPWMQKSVSMHKSPTPVRHSRMNQARSEEEEKRKEEGQESPMTGGWLKESQPNKTKNLRCLQSALSRRFDQIILINSSLLSGSK